MISRTIEFTKRNMGRLLVLMSIAITLLCFSVQKEGFFLDEILSYQLSCAEFNPFVLANQPVGRLAKFVNEELRGETFSETASNLIETVADVLENKGNSKLLQYRADVYPEPVWITGKQFQDYMTVTEADDFNYLSVYFNTRADIHPPLYYMALHTISSIAKGSASPLISCALNIAFILCICVCLMKLFDLMEKYGMLPIGYGKYAGYSAALLYGISSGTIATALLARMYALLALFCVLSFYLHVKKWYEQGFASKRIALILVTVGGFLTQYFFLFFCIPLAVVTAICLLVKKRYKELWNYIGSMIIAAIAGVGLFPFCISDVFSSAFGVEITSVLGSGFADYGKALCQFLGFWVERYFGNLLYGIIILVAVVALYLVFRIKNRNRESTAGKGKFVPFWTMLIIAVVGYFCLTAKASVLRHDRYMMPIFPFGAIMLAYLLVMIVSNLKRVTAHVMLIPVVLFSIIGVATYDGKFLYKGYTEQVELAKEYGDLPCICIYAWDYFYENLLELMWYEKSLIMQLGEFEQRQNTADLTELDEFVVIRKDSVDEQRVLQTAEGYGWELQEILMRQEESERGDTIYLFKADGSVRAE